LATLTAYLVFSVTINWKLLSIQRLPNHDSRQQYSVGFAQRRMEKTETRNRPRDVRMTADATVRQTMLGNNITNQ
jgi:hypothetical protein